jgi:hypothetical protein
MKTILTCLAGFALIGSALAGETYRSLEQCPTTNGTTSRHNRSAGPEGTYYRSNFARNAVILTNDTPNFVTFFVYDGDLTGPNDIHHMVRIGAQVYPVVVPPYQKSYADQRGRRYWVCAKPGKWGIDLQTNRIVRS